MKLSSNLALILFLTLSFVISCNSDKESKPTKPTTAKEASAENPKSKVVFYINDRPVNKQQLVGPDLNSAINNEIIYEMAVKQGLDKDESIVNRVEQFKKNILTSKIKSQVIKDYLSSTTVTDEQLQAYYEEIKDKYARLDLTQIMLDDEETANAVHAKITSSDNVDNTLEEQKKAGVKIITKKLNETRNYDRNFESTMKIGTISKPIKGRNKYNIYRIDNITYTPLETIKQQLQYQLTSKNRTIAIDEYVKKSIAENNIKIKKVN